MYIAIGNSIGASSRVNAGGGGGGFTNTYSLAFDGVDDYINGGNSSDLQITSDISISVWFKTSSTNTMIMVAKRDSPLGGNSYGYQVYCSGGKVIFLVTRSGLTTTSVVGTTTISDGRWHHALCTINQSTQISIVLDGATEGTSSLPAGTFIESGSDLLIGYNQIGAASYYFNGALDEVAIFNSLQSGSVIYNGGVPNDLTSLNPVAWYRNGDNGTWKSPQWLIPNNENKTKFSNYSFEYDGVDDRIVIPHSTSLDVVTGNHSLSFWMKANVGTTTVVMEKGRGDELAAFIISNRIYWGGVNAFYGGSTNINDNNWHHIVFVATGTTSEIFIDGSSVATGGNKVEASSNTEPFTIGTDANGNNDFTGLLDEISIFNYALSSSEITTMYNSGVPSDILSLSPVGYWRSEQSIFTDNWLVDNSALSNYSTRSFNFDGVDDYMTVATPTTLTDFTTSVWLHRTGNGNYDGIFGQDSSTAKGGILRYVSLDGTNITLFLTSGWTAMSGALAIDTWHHFALTYDSTANELKSYINGSLYTTISSPDFSGQSTDAHSFSRIGMRNGSTATSFPGLLDEIALWNTALTDISSIYNSGEPARIEGAVAHWRMGEDATFNTNWNVPDQVGSSTGTSVNMTIADLEGEAPNYTGGGLSNNMTIEDRVGDAPNSTSNAVSLNMDEVDRETDVPS